MVHQNTKKTKKFQNIKSSVFKLQASSIFFATLNYNSESWCDICKDFTNTINVEVDRDKDQIMVARIEEAHEKPQGLQILGSLYHKIYTV